MCCNGETINDRVFRSDAPLSPRGEQFATRLARFMKQLRSSTSFSSTTSGSSAQQQPQLRIWTSPRQRSAGSAARFPSLYDATPFTIRQKSGLVEINAGAVDGLTDDEVRAAFGEEWAWHQREPYTHRYPRAESYHDLALRLEEVLLELEREKDDVLIIAHQTVLRCIYAYVCGEGVGCGCVWYGFRYLLDRSEEEIPTLDIPKETVLELIPAAYGCHEKRYVVSD